MTNLFPKFIGGLVLAAVILCTGATRSHAWEAVLEDGDGWRISLNRHGNSSYKFSGELTYSTIYLYVGPVFAWQDRTYSKLVIISTANIESTEAGARNYATHVITYSFDWIDQSKLHGDYGFIRGSKKAMGSTSARLIEGTMGSHSAPAEISMSSGSPKSTQAPGKTADTALSNPSVNGVSLALNQSEFRSGDTLELFLSIDAAVLGNATADLWVRIISPSGKVIYINPDNRLSDKAIALKQAWPVEDIPPGTVLSTLIPDAWESGDHLFQAILTQPGSSPESMTSWVSSAFALAKVITQYNAMGNRVIRMGALFPLTGELSETGAASKEAFQLAVDDMNEAFQSMGLSVFVQQLIADTETQPSVAYRQFDSLETLGAEIIVGPMSSASAQVVGNLSKQKDLVYVSASATSIELAQADDNFMRLVPDDSHQARALSETIQQEGVTSLAILARTDIYGRSLAQELSSHLADAGGEAFWVRYYGRGDNDPESLIAELSAAVSEVLNGGRSPSSVGVLLVSFSEAVDLLRAASEDPILSTVRWFGTDGVALDATLIADEAAAGFAVQVGFSCSMPTRYENSSYTQIEQELTEILGFLPHPYALGYYDAAWLSTLSILMAGENRESPEAVMEKLRWLMQFYIGATGPFVLNQADDRVNSRYDFWRVAKDGDAYAWQLMGQWEESDVTKRPPALLHPEGLMELITNRVLPGLMTQ